mmetsp:Transcript_54971/g.170276  ORF Transcript_54971/g.170276 Transcript_54971/m.170276 type:complete len:194 (-) Transcript_54971:278-859(-)
MERSSTVRKMAARGARARSLRAALAAALCLACCILGRSLSFATAARPALRTAPSHRTSVARAATLAPSPVKPRTETPGAPQPLDETRYGEAVRWLFEEDEEEPPAWNILLLDKTFQERGNTLDYVVACIVAVLGLSQAVATQKTAHAREHYFSVLETCKDQKDAFKKAKELQSRKLLVRVTPAAKLPEVDKDE